MLPSCLSFTTTSINASVPPVIASTWYSSSSISAKSFILFLTANKAASTGPIPIPASRTSLLSMLSRIEAVGVTLFPETMVRSISSTTFSASIPITSSVIACKSTSVTHLPLSPNDFILLNICWNC